MDSTFLSCGDLNLNTDPGVSRLLVIHGWVLYLARKPFFRHQECSEGTQHFWRQTGTEKAINADDHRSCSGLQQGSVVDKNGEADNTILILPVSSRQQVVGNGTKQLNIQSPLFHHDDKNTSTMFPVLRCAGGK
jgi:hypothetical protein